jgi:hypothetical protein
VSQPNWSTLELMAVAAAPKIKDKEVVFARTRQGPLLSAAAFFWLDSPISPVSLGYGRTDAGFSSFLLLYRAAVYVTGPSVGRTPATRGRSALGRARWRRRY